MLNIDPQSIRVMARSADGSEGGSGTELTVSNAKFLRSLFVPLDGDAIIAVCSKAGDPTDGGWPALLSDQAETACTPDRNNYFNCSTFRDATGEALRATKDRAAKFHVLMLDDVGTKVDREKLAHLPPTYAIETSPGNFQYGYALETPLGDQVAVAKLQRAVVDAGLCDPGAQGMARWARLPNAINGKPANTGPNGSPFRCRLIEWQPERRYTVEALINQLPPSVPAVIRQTVPPAPSLIVPGLSVAVFQAAAHENPVVTRLKERGLYKRECGNGSHECTCPWVAQHTGAADSGSVYFETDATYPDGGFKCHHSHGDTLSIASLLSELGLTAAQARNRDTIRTKAGALVDVVRAAEYVLSKDESVFVQDRSIVVLVPDKAMGDVRVEPLSEVGLLLRLASADWVRLDQNGNDVQCDPPERIVKALLKAGSYQFVRQLSGIARQPWLDRATGNVTMKAGYDPASGIYGAFKEGEYDLPEPTREAAVAALAELRGLTSEFRFVTAHDKAAAISAMLTAAVRPSLPVAPGFLTTAPDSGSGKSYLNSVIVAFAGPGEPCRMSFPTDKAEASKVVLAALIGNPAALEFDDMDSDWLPFGPLNQMLTSPTCDGRILGTSKTAMVSTRVLVLGSGINVGPVRDARRRIITIRLQGRGEDGISRVFLGNPAKAVREQRSRYVGCALTIVRAWLAAGSPKADVPAIATYGDWSDLCRDALMWLGMEDPAQSLLAQVEKDPDDELFGEILVEWYQVHGATPVTVRSVASSYGKSDALHEMFMDLPVTEHGSINPGKLGWFLKKHADRHIGGYVLREARADGRKGWKVERVKPPVLPVSHHPLATSEQGSGIAA